MRTDSLDTGSVAHIAGKFDLEKLVVVMKNAESCSSSRGISRCTIAILLRARLSEQVTKKAYGQI